jgi:hypothetical protein
MRDEEGEQVREMRLGEHIGRKMRGTKQPTLMIVPSFAAAGFGSIPAPGLYGTSSPSW